MYISGHWKGKQVKRFLLCLVCVCAFLPASAVTFSRLYSEPLPLGTNSTANYYTYVAGEYGPDAFVMTWAIPNTNSVTIPSASSGTYDCLIYWGDRSPVEKVTAWNDSDLTHSYAAAGNYQIVISGTFSRIYFNDGGDKLLLTSIDQLGSTGWKSFVAAFYGCANLVTGNCGGSDVSDVTTFTYAWRNCGSLTNLGDLSAWDVSNVTMFAYAWRNCSSLTNKVVMTWPATLTTAQNGWYNAPQVIGDISQVTNLAVNNLFLNFYNCDGLTYSTSPGSLSSNIAHNIDIVWSQGSLIQSHVNNVLVDLDASGATNGTVDLSGAGMAAPSAPGLVAVANLIGKTWTVTVN